MSFVFHILSCDKTEFSSLLNISAVTSSPKSVTTAVEQTLTCEIGGLDSGHPVTVVWKDPDGAVVFNTDTTNYSLYPGTVVGGNQAAVLTIKPPKLLSYKNKATFTYKCSVTSSQYSDSSASSEVDVIANVLKLGWSWF